MCYSKMLYLYVFGCIGCLAYFGWDSFVNFHDVFVIDQYDGLTRLSLRYRSPNPFNLFKDIKELITNRTFDVVALKAKNIFQETNK